MFFGLIMLGDLDDAIHFIPILPIFPFALQLNILPLCNCI